MILIKILLCYGLYALGWGRAELPCRLGAFNYNKHLVPAMPIVCMGAPARLTVYHGGSMQGFTSAVYTFPETKTAVFALQTSTALCDACDWVPQLVIQTLFGSPQQFPIDFEQLAEISAARGTTLAASIAKQLDDQRKPGTSPRSLPDYAGRYLNSAKTLHIDISVNAAGQQLQMCFQSIESETYTMKHYHHDSFTWNASHNETARQERFQTRPVCSYKIEFESRGESGDRDTIDMLRWMYDETHPEPGSFLKEC